MKSTGLTAFFSSVALGLGAISTASAAPLGQSLAAVNDGDSPVVSADLRPYRHCHRASGRLWCHGPHYYPYDDYGYEPLPFFMPYYWYGYPEYYRDRRYYGRRDYGRRSYGPREGRRDGGGRGRR